MKIAFFVPLLHSKTILFDRKREQAFLVMLLENIQSHSTIIFWWSRTSNIKLIDRGAPLSLSVWSSHSWASGYHHGTGGRSHHWGPWHHWHVASHRWPHSRSRSHSHPPRRRKRAHHWHHRRAPHMGCWHHTRARRTRWNEEWGLRLAYAYTLTIYFLNETNKASWSGPNHVNNKLLMVSFITVDA